jgi:putative Ca2+/H+ antiporter (TMEM165/GDT1 family)
MDHFLIPFVTIAIAELFDKSQLAILLLSSRTKNHLSLFAGVSAAFIFLTAIAVLIGGSITSLVPELALKIVASVFFFYFGVKTLLEKPEIETGTPKTNATFLGSFLLILVSELGDKTQLATVAFATKFSPLFVFLGAAIALILLAIVAIWLGKILAKTERKAMVSKIAGVLFILLGITFLLR